MPRGIPNKKEEVGELNEREILFLQSLRDVLPAYRLHSDKQLLVRIGREIVEDLSLQFFSYIEYGVDETLSKNEKLALSSQIWKAIVKYITNVNTPVTLNSLLSSVQFIESAMNDAFPGYAKSKLLKHAIRSSAA